MRANWPFSKGNRQLLLQGIPKPGGRSPNGRFQDLETKNAPSTLLPKTRAKSCFRILKPDFETGLQRQCAILLEPWCRSSAQFCFKALEQVGPPDVGPALPAFPAGAAKLPLAFCRIAYQNKNTRCAIRPDKRPDGNGQTDGHAPGFFITKGNANFSTVLLQKAETPAFLTRDTHTWVLIIDLQIITALVLEKKEQQSHYVTTTSQF
jgi:hypothetical protein